MNGTDQKSLEGNINKICWMTFLDGMWFPGAVFVIFLLDNGMNLAQVGLILSANAIMPFLFDIPSSIWADRYSRKSMLILMSAAYLLQNAIYTFAHSFDMLFVATCFNGIGTALSLGITGAFVYDTLISVGKEGRYEKIQSKITAYRYAGALLASVGGFIYLANPRAVFLLAAIVTTASLFIAFALKEPFRGKSISKPLGHIKEGLAFLFKHKIIWHLVVTFSLMAGICELLFNFYQPVMKSAGIPLAYFGIIYFFANSFSFLGAVAYPKLREHIDWRKIMLLYLLVTLFATSSFATGSQFLIVAAIAVASVSLGMQGIFIGNVINKIVPSSHRAVALSIQTQMHLIFNFILLVAVSGISEKFSISAGMLLVSVIVIIASAAFLKLTGKRIAAVENSGI